MEFYNLVRKLAEYGLKMLEEKGGWGVKDKILSWTKRRAMLSSSSRCPLISSPQQSKKRKKSRAAADCGSSLWRL